MKLYMIPCQEEDFPQSGGVRTHLVHLKKYLNELDGLTLLPKRAIQMADVQLVEATYAPIPTELPMVYVNHGGFIPTPSPQVMRNLRRADFIISVADWVSQRFYPQYAYKTATIPNGLDLDEFKNLPPSGLEPGYILYGKEWAYFFGDFIQMVNALPSQHFVTVYWPYGETLPKNVTYIGRQQPAKMKAIIRDAGMLLLTGSEVCPIMLLEAWACRTPVLARGMDGSLELMQPFRPDCDTIIGGVLYVNVRMAINSVAYILNERTMLGNQGRLRVEEMYQWKNLISRYKTVCESVHRG